MKRTRQGRFRFNDHHRAWDALPAAVRAAVIERLRELWLAAFHRQLEAMRDDVRQDHA
jgi:predicted Fe-S protein YdhL (DUF1289 family)